jgi:hypothetical protein
VIRETLRAKDSLQHPVCRTIRSAGESFTFGATIMTLSGTPSLAVTLGPPDVNPFVRVDFWTVAPPDRVAGSSASAAQHPKTP